MSNIEEDFDLSELKVVDESGEAQPVELPTQEAPEATEATEATEGETPEVVEEEKEESPVEETPDVPENNEKPEEEEPLNTSDFEESSPQPLIKELDEISKELSGGDFDNLESLFEDYKRMRDSSGQVFKDDFIKNAVEYYNANGTLTPYLEATSIDFDNMSDEQIMRYDLEKSNPTLSKRALDKLYQNSVVNKFSLDEDKFDEDDVELGKELLKAEATKLKSKYVDEQKSFTAPPKTDKTQEEQLEQEQIAKQWTEQVSTSPSTKSVLENKRILIEYGDDKFSYEVENPEELQAMTIDNNKFFDLFRDEAGTIDFDKWYRVLAYAVDPDVYDSSLISHGQELGQEKVVSDLKNPTRPTKSSQEYKTPKNPLEGLIGALSRGDSDVKIIR